MADCAVVLLNRCEVGKDGRTAFLAFQGQEGDAVRHRFRREVLFRRHPSGGRLAQLSSMLEDSIFFGVRSVSADCRQCCRSLTNQKPCAADSSTDGPLEKVYKACACPRNRMEPGAAG